MRKYLLLIISTLIMGSLWAQERYCVDVDHLNVRDNPSTNAAIIAVMEQGEVLEVIDVDGEWAEIIYKENRAWVSSEFISTLPPSTSVANRDYTELMNSYPILKDVTKLKIPLALVIGILALNIFCFVLFRSNFKLSDFLISVVRLLIPISAIASIVILINYEEIVSIIDSLPDYTLLFILTLIIYSGIVYIQLVNAIEYIEIVSINSKIHFPMVFTIFSWSITIPLTLLCELYIPSALPYMIAVIVLCQLYIALNVLSHTSSKTKGIILWIKYLVVALPTATLAAILIHATTIIGILLLLIYGILGFLLSGSMSFAPSKCSNFSEESDSQCKIHKERGHNNFTCPFKGNKYECHL